VREHGELKKLIGYIRDGGDDAAREEGMQALMQSVAHHVHEEERTLLPQAEQRLGAELERVGARMQQRKQETLPPTAAAE
jgi:hemerythrin-like domain-containing protein